MKELLLWLREYGLLLLTMLLILILLQHCNQSRKINKSIKTIKELTVSIEDLKKNSVLKEESAILFEIERLQTAKLVLYDWNTVVRQVVRPDDRMNEYDIQIAALQKELEQLRKNKGANVK